MNNIKVNWADKDNLENIVNNSTSYNQVLKSLGIKVIGSNVKTLKKYIEKYDINVSHFTYLKEENIVDNVSYNIINGNEPRFKLEGILKDPARGLRVELDWNEEFVNYLKQVGFTGSNDEEIVGKFLQDMYKPLGQRMQN